MPSKPLLNVFDPVARQSAGTSNTLGSTAYELLRHEIVSAALLPGEKILIETLCARYQMSSSPVREALNRLSAEGLVSKEDQKGFRVPPISLDDLAELTRTRCWVNEIALREAIAHGTEDWEEEIVLSLHRLSRFETFGAKRDAEGLKEWERRHHRFHAALIAACPSRLLRDFSETLFSRADRYRHLAAAPANGRSRDIAGEHHEIVQAVINRETSNAIRLLNDHLIQTAEEVRRTLPVFANGSDAIAAREIKVINVK